jgi:non-ribosomal peptide synthetase component F
VHGSQTVHDATVRKALQLKPDAFELTGGFGEAELAKIVDEVKHMLVPDAEQVTAVLHKLNVYQEGGFFADHRDTPRNESHFGSLVVLLPCTFGGGELSLDHGGLTERFDWASHVNHRPSRLSWLASQASVAASAPPSQLCWAAFFGDAVHRVKHVTSGASVTLAHELHRTGAPVPAADALLVRTECLRRAFVEALREPHFLAQGGTVGYDGSHE